MRGVITGRDVLANFRIIWREFGLSCLLRCLYASASGKPCTFLDCAMKTEQR